MTNYNDIFTSDGINTIYKTSKAYSEGSVLVKYTTSSGFEPTPCLELGEDYVQLIGIVPPEGSSVHVEYNIRGSMPLDNQQEFDIKERLVKLEKAVEGLHTIIKAQEKALENRVNITAFRAWTKLIEKKTGIKLIDRDLGIITTELSKD